MHSRQGEYLMLIVLGDSAGKSNEPKPLINECQDEICWDGEVLFPAFIKFLDEGLLFLLDLEKCDEKLKGINKKISLTNQ